MTTIDSSAKSGLVSTSGNENLSLSVSENAALFETLFGLMQTATDIPDALEAQTGIEADGVTASTDIASLPAIIASVPLGSAVSAGGSHQLFEHMNSFMTPLDDSSKGDAVPAMPDASKTEISAGALAMAQTLLVAQSVGLVDAVADPDSDNDTPATLDLKINSPIPAMKAGYYDSVPDAPVTVPAELFEKARELVKGEVATPSRKTYDTGPQPVQQLMNFLKQAVVPKDEKSQRVQPLKTPLTDDAMPNVMAISSDDSVTYDAPHTVLTSVDMLAKTAPMPNLVSNVAQDVVTYSEPHTVLSAQQSSQLSNIVPMPNVMTRTAGDAVAYDAPHTVLTASEMASRQAPMPTLVGKVTEDTVLYSEKHTVSEAKAEFKPFDVVQAEKRDKAQMAKGIENSVISPTPKDLAARASIIIDNGNIRMHSEKPVSQRQGGDIAALSQTADSNNGSGTQNNSNRVDGGGFDQSSRGNAQIMTAHRLNMADKSWQEGFIRRIESSIKNGDGVIRIALEPRQLGRMQVKLGFNGDAMRVQITTETAAAAALLSDNEARLSQMLDQAGLRLGSLQTNTTGASAFDLNNNMGGQANSGQTGTSSGNDDHNDGKNQSADARGGTDNVEETANTLENDNKTVLNILA